MTQLKWLLICPGILFCQPHLDLRWSEYPFIKKINPDTSDNAWKVLVFYLNQDADKIPFFYSDLQYASLENRDPIKSYGQWGSTISNAVSLKYKSCSAGGDTVGTALILPDSLSRCSSDYGGIRNHTQKFSELTQTNLLVNATLPSFINSPAAEDL